MSTATDTMTDSEIRELLSPSLAKSTWETNFIHDLTAGRAATNVLTARQREFALNIINDTRPPFRRRARRAAPATPTRARRAPRRTAAAPAAAKRVTKAFGAPAVQTESAAIQLSQLSEDIRSGDLSHWSVESFTQLKEFISTTLDSIQLP